MLLDGTTGEVVIDPSPEHQRAAVEQAAADKARIAAASGPGHTADGTPVQLLVNIGTVDDAVKAGPVDSEGVGLFRTEFMYLGKASAPSLDEQTASYTRFSNSSPGRQRGGPDSRLPGRTSHCRFSISVARRIRRSACAGCGSARCSRRRLPRNSRRSRRAGKATGADLWVMAPMVATADEAGGFAALARDPG